MQAVIVEFRYGSGHMADIYNLEDEVEAAIVGAEAGEFDGDEFSAKSDDARLYMYGPDADMLFNVVAPVLRKSDLMKDAMIVRRYGDGDGAPERKTPLA